MYGKPQVRKAIPALLFSIGLLVLIFIVFAVIEWARYHT